MLENVKLGKYLQYQTERLTDKSQTPLAEACGPELLETAVNREYGWE